MPELNVYDQFDAGPPQAAVNPYDAFDAPQAEPQAPHKFGLGDTWPAKLAKTVWGAVSLPHDVWTGEVDPMSPEGIGRAAELAQVINPVEQMGRGVLMGGALPKAAAKAAETPLNVQAAQAAQGAGESLPIGLVSPNPVMRATTRIAESLPLVGPGITERVGRSVEAAGGQVGDIARCLRGDATSRADVGEAVRPGLEGAIANNKSAMSAEYDGVRDLFDTSQQMPLPETKAALDRVLAQRGKLKNPMAGLDNIAELVKQPAAPEMGPTVLRGMEGLTDQAAAAPWGANFEELQRTRSDFGRATKFGEPNPGYSEGERKFLYGAMSKDMENIARQGGGEEAVSALQTANANASQVHRAERRAAEAAQQVIE